MAAKFWIGIAAAFALAIAGPARAAAESAEVPVEQIYEFLKAEVATPVSYTHLTLPTNREV